MEEKHISKTHCLSLREKGKRHAQTKRFYPVRNKNPQSGNWKISNGLYLNRTFGSDCHYCVIDGDIDAGAAAGKETGQGCCMQK
jgi:hypothetical protein